MSKSTYPTSVLSAFEETFMGKPSARETSDVNTDYLDSDRDGVPPDNRRRDYTSQNRKAASQRISTTQDRAHFLESPPREPVPVKPPTRMYITRRKKRAT